MKNCKKTILIAEDDAFLMEMMAKELESHGVNVVIARDGQEAIEKIEKSVPDLLLLDMLMPRVDGLGVLQHIALKKVKLPTVILSNLSNTLTQDECKKFGVLSYCIKSSMDDDELWPCIEKYIR
jgi:CheY-like chemotaxis protein